MDKYQVLSTVAALADENGRVEISEFRNALGVPDFTETTNALIASGDIARIVGARDIYFILTPNGENFLSAAKEAAANKKLQIAGIVIGVLTLISTLIGIAVSIGLQP